MDADLYDAVWEEMLNAKLSVRYWRVRLTIAHVISAFFKLTVPLLASGAFVLWIRDNSPWLGPWLALGAAVMQVLQTGIAASETAIRAQYLHRQWVQFERDALLAFEDCRAQNPDFGRKVVDDLRRRRGDIEGAEAALIEFEWLRDRAQEAVKRADARRFTHQAKDRASSAAAAEAEAHPSLSPPG